MTAATQAQELLQRVAQTVQKTVHVRLASVVSKCLRAVFLDPYEFKILFDRTRGKTAARLVFTKGDQEFDPGFEVGGGVLDVASFALWVACLMAKRPAPRLFLCADEPFKNVNGSVAQERLARLLPLLADEFGIQFLFVTDDDWLKTGKIVNVGG